MPEVNVSRRHDGQGQSESPGISTREGPHAMRRNWPSSFRPFDAFNNPFAMLRHLNEEMDRVFPRGYSSQGQSDWTPAIDISERNNELQICADLPGVDQKDVKIEVENGMLSISGERKQEREEDSGGVHRMERTYGSFYRSVQLPDGVNLDNARAQFNNGELKISVPLPKKEQQSRQIPIQTDTGK